jgi:hypothetical protein
MGLGSAAGWLWERLHRSRRRVRPGEDERAIAATTSPVRSSVSAAAAAPGKPDGTATAAVAGLPTGPSVASASKTLVIIFGPPAVGKMAVGDALARRTGLRLFHNHLTIDPVLRFFEFGSPPFRRLVSEFRTRIFEEVAASTLPGLIFTYVWAFEDDSDARYVERVSAIFRGRGADVFLVELEASQVERLRRNETEFRLAEKVPKRDLAASRRQLLELDVKHRLNSTDELTGRPDYLRIENSALSPDEVAERIIQRFGLTTMSMEMV